MYAVVKTGGKQYRVAANDLLRVEKLNGAPGDIVELGEVLMVAGEDGIEVGNPLIAGASVAAEIVGHVRGDRIIIFKKRRRSHYRRRNGHRQDLTQVRITEILTGGARPSKKSAAPPAEAELVVPSSVEAVEIFEDTLPEAAVSPAVPEPEAAVSPAVPEPEAAVSPAVPEPEAAVSPAVPEPEAAQAEPEAAPAETRAKPKAATPSKAKKPPAKRK